MEIIRGRTDFTPEEAGYDVSRLDALHRHLWKLIESGSLQCASYCLSRRGKIFAHNAMGRLEFDNPTKPFLPDTTNRIASVTKLFTTVAILKLIEDGHFRLDTQVQTILPEFKKDPFWKITVFHLLTHTSGMMPDKNDGYPDMKERKDYYQLVDEYIQTYASLDSKTAGEFNWLEAALEGGVRREPGVEWQYCTFGFTVLGEIIAKVSGKPASEYMKDEIFIPLGLNDTALGLTPELAKRHIVKSERHREYFSRLIYGGMDEGKADNLWNQIPDTGGGVTSTIADMVRFGNMCLYKGRLDGVRIVGRKILERATSYTLRNIPNYAWNVNDPDRAFGIGFDMKKDAEYVYSKGSFFHEGADFSALLMDPVEEFTAAIFVPFDNPPDSGWCPEAIYNTQIIIWSGII